MKDRQFFIRYISENNCFLQLSESWIKQIKNNSAECVLRMDHGNKCSSYFSWSPQSCMSIEGNAVGINAIYARALGLQEGEVVSISTHPKVTSVSRINVSPQTVEDWEILELSSAAVQSSMLNQIRVVYQHQVLVTWISKSMHISLRVDELEPECEVGRLEVFSEVVVAPPRSNKDTIFTETYQFPSEFPSYIDMPNAVAQDSNTIPPTDANVWQTLKKHLHNILYGDKNDNEQLHSSHKVAEDKTIASLKRFSNKPLNIYVYRVHPLHICATQVGAKQGDKLLSNPYCALVRRSHLPKALQNLSSNNTIGLVCKLMKVTNSAYATHSGSNATLSNSETIRQIEDNDANVKSTAVSAYVQLFVIEDYYDDMSDYVKQYVDKATIKCMPQRRSLLVSDAVRALLGLKIGSQVTLEMLSLAEIGVTSGVQIKLTGKGDSKQMETFFRLYLAQEVEKHGFTVVNTASIFQVGMLPEVMPILVILGPGEMDYAVLDSEALRKCKIFVKDSKASVTIPALPDGPAYDQLKYMHLDHLEKLITEGITTMEVSLGLLPAVAKIQPGSTDLPANNILILGLEGSGKSTLHKAICNQLKKPPHFVHCVTLECKYLKGKTVETIEKKLSSLLGECIYYQPAVIVLDDLDVIAAVTDSSSSQEGEEDYFIRVGEKLSGLLDTYQASNAVSVIATAVAVSKLNTSLVAPRGRHIFQTFLKLPELTKANRLEIFKTTFAVKTSTAEKLLNLHWNEHITKMDGYVVQDLVDLVDKAIFEACKNKRSFDNIEDLAVDVRNADLEAAIKHFVPLSQRGMELYHNDTRSWNDVGGLSSVKEVLIELLEWPSKYPELFKNSPLRHQSGLLLYGAPGTGKTLLASVVASECGLKFISIKGPELLSKYIGASEEGVRNIFQKAQSAKPCILFFDEFDSLAPRRGHDSTGVTDRVVNQLLTQLDGVESLDGVWVLAATSRPDLLDPALLRPGRLDRAVLCPLPNKEERLSILQALSRKMKLSKDVDFEEIARAAEGFTGADLQAVLYTAQIAPLEQIINSSAGENIKASVNSKEECVDGTDVGEKQKVTMSHLLKALHETRPSLSKTELHKYQRIYEKFARSGNATSAEEIASLPQRATLA